MYCSSVLFLYHLCPSSTLIHCVVCAVLFRGIEGGPSTIAAVNKMVQNRTFEKLVDFDNHLDNIQSDWTNPAINRAVEDVGNASRD